MASEQVLKAMGIKPTQVLKPTQVTRASKETKDSTKQREVRELMKNTFLGHCEIMSGTHFVKEFVRDENKKIVKESDGSNKIKGYIPKLLNGSFLLEDLKNGTHRATRFNIYKDEYIVDGETLKVTKVTNGS